GAVRAVREECAIIEPDVRGHGGGGVWTCRCRVKRPSTQNRLTASVRRYAQETSHGHDPSGPARAAAHSPVIGHSNPPAELLVAERDLAREPERMRAASLRATAGLCR